MKALFLDLDHTLIRPLEGRTFPKDKYDWEFVPGMIERVTPYVADGQKVILITNQGGVEAGFQTEAEVKHKLGFVLSDLIWNIGNIDKVPYELRHKQVAYYYCTTNNKSHPDRKPNPGMILTAAKEHDIELASSLFVGDMDTDREAAEAAGVPYCHVADFLA